MCHAFALQGFDVKLVVPNIKQAATEKHEEFSFYGVERVFSIIRFPWYSFPGSKYLYSLCIALWLLFRKREVLYFRDFYPALFCSYLGMPVVLELHKVPRKHPGIKGRLITKFFRSPNLRRVVVITEALKRLISKEIPGLDGKIEVAPDASDHHLGKIEKISLKGTFKAGYVGHLYRGKGMETIADIVPKLPEIDFHIVGGRDADIQLWSQKLDYDNITFHGFVPQSSVPSYINAMDVCLLPNQDIVRDVSGIDIGQFTSPLKMFDYMAAGKPIVSSDLPVLKEVLNEDNAVLCNSKDPSDWIRAIKALRHNEGLRQKIGARAQKDYLENYTWEKRAKNILHAIEA